MASVSPRPGSTFAARPPAAAASFRPDGSSAEASTSSTQAGQQHQPTISTHLSSVKRSSGAGSSSGSGSKLGRKRSQPEESAPSVLPSPSHEPRWDDELTLRPSFRLVPTAARPLSGPGSASSSTSSGAVAAASSVDPTARTVTQSPTKRRPSPTNMVQQQQRPPPPAPIQYYAHSALPPPPGGGPAFDPSLFYAVVPSSHAAAAVGRPPYPPPMPPPHHLAAGHAPPPPFFQPTGVPQPPRARPNVVRQPSSEAAGPSQAAVARPTSSSSPAKPTAAALPQLSSAPATAAVPPPASAQHDASSSSSVKPEAAAVDGPPAPKPKRKYTKKADFWIENGGPGRRGLLASKNDARADTPAGDGAKSTPQPSSAVLSKANSSTGGSTGRKRAGSSARRPAPKSAVAPAPSTAESSSSIPRAAAPLAKPHAMPRTISAPALLTAEDGTVSLSSTQVLASELAWLVPSRERLFNTSSRRASVARTPADDEAARERSRKRLAAFEDDEEALAFFASPLKENARPSLSRAPSSSHGRPPALVAARVAGMGRVAIAQGSLQRMAEAGARPVVEAVPQLSASISASSSASSVVAPDWPDSCHPWVESEADRRRSQTDERREVLLSVKQYLDSASDDEEDASGDDDTPRRRSSYASTVSSDDEGLDWARRGGKSSSMLLSTNRQSRLKNSQSVPSLTAAFDTSDARQALIYRTQVSAPHAAFEHGYPAPSSPSEAAPDDDDRVPAADVRQCIVGPGAIACICRDHVAEGAMVECNGCTFWFHLPCLGIQEADLGDEWFCWRCAPAGDQLPTQLSEPAPVPRTPKTASPDLADGSDGGNDDDPGTPATVALEPSPMFGSGRHQADALDTPVQGGRFGTPLLPSATGFTTFQSPAYARASGGHQQRLPPPLPLLLHHGTPGPSRPWDHRHVLTPRVPSHTRDHEEALFDLSSTPSRHLTRELPFGGTPLSRVGGAGAGRGGARGGPRLPSFGSFATPSQEFFNGLHASPHPSSSSGGQLPGLDHYLSSADSSGPLSPYQPIHNKWHHSPSIQMPHPGVGRGGGPSSGRSHLRPGSAGEPRQAKEQERFGEPLDGLRGGFQPSHD